MMDVQTKIAWKPISQITGSRMDGRDVLLWAGCAILGSWCDGWRNSVGRPVVGVTDFADVEGPGV